MATMFNEIAKGFAPDSFLELNLDIFPSADWAKALEIFRLRIDLRYLNPLKSLKTLNDSYNTYGFIVLTAAFALVETLEGFRKGITDHSRRSQELFEAGLAGLKVYEGLASRDLTTIEKTALYKQGRCALLHSGGTDSISIAISGNILEKLPDQSYRINRDEFVEWISIKFDEYLSEIKLEESQELREYFRVKMTYISKNS